MAILCALASPLGAQNTKAVGLNFGEAGYVLLPSDSVGLPPDAQSNWNDLIGATGSNPTTLVNGSGTATSLSASWQSANSWRNGATGSPTAKLIGAYLDDGATTGASAFRAYGPKVTVSGISYPKYTVYVGCGTDQATWTAGAMWQPIEVNGTVYSAVGTATVVGSGVWGSRDDNALALGTNVLRITGQTSPTLTVNGHSRNGNTRGSITFVQIVQEGLPTINSLAASPGRILSPGSSTLSWSATSPDGSPLAYTLNGNPATGPSEIVSPSATTTYTLTATNGSGSDSKEVTVRVNEAPAVLTFTSSPDIVLAGSSATFSWTTEAATSVTLNPGAISLPPNGTTTLPMPTAGAAVYTLTAANDFGTATAKTIVRTFSPTTDTLTINEVYYHHTVKGRPGEFIELYNWGPSPVDVSGWFFSEGVSYQFPAGSSVPAGGYAVVAADPAYFQSVFGKTAFGPWSGSLSNEGEQIRLRDALGVIRSTVSYGVGFPWPVSPDGDGPSLELVHPGLNNDLAGSWRPSAGAPTPGARNSVAESFAIPPAVRQVGHLPQTPTAAQSLRLADGRAVEIQPAQAVVVTAKVTDPDGLASVALLLQTVAPGSYLPRTDPAYGQIASWTEFAMADNGVAPDTLAGDGIYTVLIPGEYQTNRSIVRYRITSVDSLGNSLTVPHADDPQPNFAYFVYAGVPDWTGANNPGTTTAATYPAASLTTNAPVYHLVTRNADIENCLWNAANGSYEDYRFLGAFVYDGVVYDHIGYRVRGSGSTYRTGKNKLKINFTKTHPLQARDNYGKKFPTTWDKINLNAGTCPWWGYGSPGTDQDEEGLVLNEAAAHKLFNLAGAPAPGTVLSHFRIIRYASENGADNMPGGSAATQAQYYTDFFGLYIAIEQPDGNYLDARDLPDGNLFKIEGTAAASSFRNQGPYPQATDRSDLTSFISTTTGYNFGITGAFPNQVFNTRQPYAWYQANLDITNYARVHATNLAVNNSDLRPEQNYNYYLNPLTNKWTILPWDMDLAFEPAPHLGRSDLSYENIQQVFAHTEAARERDNAVRDLLNLVYNTETTNLVVQELAEHIYTFPDPTSVPAPFDATIAKSGSIVTVTVNSGTLPAWITDGASFTVGGAAPSTYNGAKTVTTRLSDTQFTYTQNAFSITDNTVTISPPTVTSSAIPSLADANRALWDYHPRYVAGFRGHFYLYSGTSGLNPAKDFPGMVQQLKNFLKPGATVAGNIPASGAADFGYAKLRAKLAERNFPVPDKPAATALTASFASNDLRFSTSAFAGAGQTFAGLKWRIAETYHPGIPGYIPRTAYRHEATAVQEKESATFAATTQFSPVGVVPGRTYRVRVKMKNTDGMWSDWSDPVSFTAAAPDLASFHNSLLITEINYNPGVATAAESAQGFVTQDFEFVEVKNISATSLDLTNLRFSDGIGFDFATGTPTSLNAGQSGVVVKNIAAFRARYGNGPLVFGSYGSDNLANDGEKLTISYGSSGSVVSFTYGDSNSPGWPAEADGVGKTLVLINSSSAAPDYSASAQWRASAAPGGTPGADEEAGLSLETWAASVFTPEQLADPLVSGATADPDGDGLPNLLEFALGGSPLDTSSAPRPSVSVGTHNVSEQIGSYLTLTYTIRTGATGFTLSPEVVDGIGGAWAPTPVVVGSVANPDGTTTITVRDTVRLDTSPSPPQRFFRLHLNTP